MSPPSRDCSLHSPGFRRVRVRHQREHDPTAARPYDTSAMPEGSRSREIVPSRRPVSQQRYAVRRFGVVVVLGLVVFGAIKAFGALTGGGEASGQQPDTSTPSTSSAAGAAPVVNSPTQPAATAPPTPPPTEPPETGPPSEDNPAEVLIVGDSDAGTFFPYLQRLLDETGVVDAEVDYVVSSGLARPDFHDWPQHLRDTMEQRDPEI